MDEVPDQLTMVRLDREGRRLLLNGFSKVLDKTKLDKEGYIWAWNKVQEPD